MLPVSQPVPFHRADDIPVKKSKDNGENDRECREYHQMQQVWRNHQVRQISFIQFPHEFLN
jgi:uncharacterized protein YbcV (DUF1398 family)